MWPQLTHLLCSSVHSTLASILCSYRSLTHSKMLFTHSFEACYWWSHWNYSCLSIKLGGPSLLPLSTHFHHLCVARIFPFVNCAALTLRIWPVIYFNISSSPTSVISLFFSINSRHRLIDGKTFIHQILTTSCYILFTRALKNFNLNSL